MCGRYALYDTAKSDLEIGHNLVGKNYNIAPLAMVPVIKDNNNIELVRWAFKVAWDTKLNIINARSETLASKLAFQNTKRCIFIANGYFEWLSRDKSKIPYYHTFNDKLMYFGGILNDQGACIVTRESYPLKVKVHRQILKNSRWINVNIENKKTSAIERKIISTAIDLKTEKS